MIPHPPHLVNPFLISTIILGYFTSKFIRRRFYTRVTLPLELILSCILPKLPVKSLLRFKCVSKSFLAEISSPEFNALFSEANRLLLLPSMFNTFRIYRLDSPKAPLTICPYPIPSPRFPTPMSIVACCESYLLIRCGETNLHRLILFNPITRIYRVIPKLYVPARSVRINYGLCHCIDNDLNDDFKIVWFLQYDGLMEVIVYSLRTNLRSINRETERIRQIIADPVVVQNHLFVMILYNDEERLTSIGCFDIKAERWSNDVLLPDSVSGRIRYNSTRDGQYYLSELEENLCFSWYDVNESTYTIWVMKDYGVEASWTKLTSLPVQGPKEIFYPIAYRKGSSNELLCIPNHCGEYLEGEYLNYKYFWYNIRDRRISKTEFYGNGRNTSYSSFAYICRGSFLNFPGGQPIRSSSK